jgi:alkanesulfonate monooxygenase SsuD/methylene tetrahydromethanopterin reductase-like flavin-dependent oxidoreductase (luciferase family)
MRFSIWPAASAAPREVLDIARWADAHGWFGVWFADHYMPNTGSTDRKPGNVYECWSVLPAIAAVTEHVRVGPLVSPTSVHHPALLANRAATIDHLSNGRMVLGLGAGWQINEHDAYGIALEPAGERASRFEEAIQIVRSLLAADRTEFHGTYYDLTDAPCDPKPVQSRLPIVVGTGRPRMSRITARYADEWNTWGTVEEAGRRRATFTAACTSVGRDPATMHMSVQVLPTFGPAEAPEGLADRWFAGSADQMRDAIGNYAAMGFDEFILPLFHVGGGASARQEFVQRFHDEIVTE